MGLFFVLPDFLHYSIGFEQDFDYALVVDQVLIVKLATFAVFEPFLGRLVATDVKIPSEFRHVAKVLSFVDPDLAVGIR